ncbi:MAG: GntR family transcriptional regulator [Nitrospirae bacterium]|nr:GntR family transcriptional regulator [Nitrospirota bacterium]
MEQIIDREKSQKLYAQLYEILKGKIERGELAVNAQIPTEDELCKIYVVSKATVRIAISELVRQGYLSSQQGKGTFVCKRIIPEGLAMLTGFKELMLEAGINFSTDVLAQTVMMPTDDLDVKLNVPDDKHIIYIKRLRSVDNEPVLLQEAYIPHNVCPPLLKEDVANNSLLELLEKKYEVKITKVKDFIEISHLNLDEAKLLALSEGSVALLLEQYFYSGDTQIMYMRSIKRPERFRFQIEFERKSA